ncbi:Desmethyl-deoxy-podophyllotoxin synthase [Linum grandiflorum]
MYFLLIFPVILLFLILLINKHKKHRNAHLPPGPRALPLIGNLFSALPHSLWQLSQIHGPLMTLKRGCVRIVVVSSANMAREIMKTHDLTFSNRQSITGQQKLSYNGLDLAFAPYGPYWREMKKICVVHLLNSRRVQSFHSIREFVVSKMIDKISSTSFGPAYKPCNLSEAVASLTITIICRVAFGQRYEEEGIERTSRLQKDQSCKVRLTFDHIKAILMNIFVGGTDTSAATIVWAMTYLMKNPITMRKAQEEVRHAVGKKRGFVNEEDTQKLSYLKAVVKETMRLQESTESCNLGGYDIPAKTVVYINAWAIGRDTEAWGHNAEEFKPERFIGKSIDVRGLDFELIPFGAGRRICPGIHMGLSTVELSLANLLYAFDWEMPVGMKSEDLDMEVLPGITMHKKKDLCLVAKSYI